MINYDALWWNMMNYDGKNKIWWTWWNMMRYDQIWWTMMKYDETWWNMMNKNKIWWNMMEKWNMIKYDQIWSNAKTIEKWWRMPQCYTKAAAKGAGSVEFHHAKALVFVAVVLRLREWRLLKSGSASAEATAERTDMKPIARPAIWIYFELFLII